MTEKMIGANLINGKEISAAEMDQLKAILESTGYPETLFKELYTDAVLQYLSGMKYDDNVEYTDAVLSNLKQSQAIVSLATQHGRSYKMQK